MKKPWLVDVPVCMQIWIRPELQRQSFAPIAIARPSTLLLVSDGGRNADEWEKIRQNRKYCEDAVDWDCTVYKLYLDQNIGMYAMCARIQEFVFSKVDRAVFFEDDTVADPTYFAFCAELLEKYKDDTRIEAIEGTNKLGTYEAPHADYFFTQGGRSTGSAFWKRSTEFFSETEWMSDPYILGILQEKNNREFMDRIRNLRETGLINGHPAWQEDLCPVTKIVGNYLTIFPTKNMVLQLGATDDAAHGVALHKLDKKTQEQYSLPLYSCEFPLRHPRYVVCDEEYLRLVAKKEGGRLEKLRRRFVTICKRIYYGDGRLLWQKFVERYVKREIRSES